MTDDNVAPPAAGWYEDPHHAGVERFWDGEVWTDDFRPPSTTPPTPPPPATKSSATTVFALGIMALIPGWGFFNGAVAWWMGRRELREIDAGLRTPDGRKKATLGRRFGMVGTLVWGPMLAIGLGAILLSSSTLLEEDFSSSSNTFSTASDEFVDLVVEDGAYIVRMKDVSLPRAVRHFLEAATATVRFEADINQSAQLSIQANQSVGCWNGLSGYLFTLENTGRAGIVEVGSETGGKRTALTEFAVAAAAQPFSEINRMRIDCAGGGTNPTVVTGWLNEEPVASVAVPGGHDSFNAVGFLLTANEPTEFRIDNVLATSALLEPAMAASPPIDGRSAGAVTDSQPDWFAENGVTYVVPAGWQIRLLGESVDGAWRYSVSPDEATDNQMMFAYLPEIVSEEMFGPAAGRIESLLSDEPGSKKVEVAGLEGVRISVDEESTDAVTGEQIRTEMVVLLDNAGGAYTLVVRYDAAHEAEMLSAWRAMLDAFEVE